MPMSSIDNTMPSAPRSMCHSAAMPGEAKAIDSTSNPSERIQSIVIATAMICRALIGAAEIVALDRRCCSLSCPWKPGTVICRA